MTKQTASEKRESDEGPAKRVQSFSLSSDVIEFIRTAGWGKASEQVERLIRRSREFREWERSNV